MTVSSLPALTKSAAGLGVLVLALAIAAVSSWVTRRVVDERAPSPDTVRVQAPLAPGEIADATMPDQVTEYDTSETRTECIEVPTWLATRAESGDTVSGRITGGQHQIQQSNGSRLPQESGVRSPAWKDSTMTSKWDGPTYAITSMMGGRPSLSVGSSEVTLSGYLPSGEGRQWTYDLPTDRWGVGLRSQLTFARWVQGTLTADVTRHAEWGPLDFETRFGLGYGALVTDGSARVSPVAQAGFRIGYDW